MQILNEISIFRDRSYESPMNSYPEFLGIYATFKLLNIHAPDSNGCSEVAGVCILVNEKRESINWMMKCFKEAHKNGIKLNVS